MQSPRYLLRFTDVVSDVILLVPKFLLHSTAVCILTEHILPLPVFCRVQLAYLMALLGKCQSFDEQYLELTQGPLPLPTTIAAHTHTFYRQFCRSKDHVRLAPARHNKKMLLQDYALQKKLHK